MTPPPNVRVEEVRARHEAERECLEQLSGSLFFDDTSYSRAHADRAALLREYDAMVKENEKLLDGIGQLQTALDAARALVTKNARVQNLHHHWICDDCGEDWPRDIARHGERCYVGQLLAILPAQEA